MLGNVAYECAICGVEEPVFFRGEQIGAHCRPNCGLLMQLLRIHHPCDYGVFEERRGWVTVRPPENGPAQFFDRIDLPDGACLPAPAIPAPAARARPARGGKPSAATKRRRD